jgi:methyl-accepting chemotaxis protein
MHHVAVSSEEQSKNVADIAAASTALSDAAGRISELAGTFKLGGS